MTLITFPSLRMIRYGLRRMLAALAGLALIIGLSHHSLLLYMVLHLLPAVASSVPQYFLYQFTLSRISDFF